MKCFTVQLPYRRGPETCHRNSHYGHLYFILSGSASTLAKCAVGELIYNLITRTDVIFHASISVKTSMGHTQRINVKLTLLHNFWKRIQNVRPTLRELRELRERRALGGGNSTGIGNALDGNDVEDSTAISSPPPSSPSSISAAVPTVVATTASDVASTSSLSSSLSSSPPPSPPLRLPLSPVRLHRPLLDLGHPPPSQSSSQSSSHSISHSSSHSSSVAPTRRPPPAARRLTPEEYGNNSFVDIFQAIEVNILDTLLSSFNPFKSGGIGTWIADINVHLMNVFNFEIEVNHVSLDFLYDDLDGVDVWYLPTYPAKSTPIAAIKDAAVDLGRLFIAPGKWGMYMFDWFIRWK